MNTTDTTGTLYAAAPGLRSLTPQSMGSRLAADCFGGLPPGVSRTDLMRAIEQGGPRCGLTAAQVQRLLYLVRHTAELDWQDDSAMPVVWVSVSRMAHDLGVSRQRIAEVERQLAEAGWLSHRDSGNRRRSGERDPATGRVVNAFGVQLGALGARYSELAASAVQRDAEWAARRALRASSSSLLCEIRRLHAALDGRVEPGDAPAAPLAGDAPLDVLEEENAALQSLRDRLAGRLAAEAADSRLVTVAEVRLVTAAGEGQGLPSGKENLPPILIQRESVTNVGNRPDGAVEEVASAEAPPEAEVGAAGDDGRGREECRRLGDPGDCGVGWISPDRVAWAASPQFRSLLAAAGPDGPGWIDVLAAADTRRRELGIHDGAWRAAGRTLGWAGAAVLVAVIDGRCEERASFVYNPPAFAVACSKLAAAGELHLHKSVWGLETRRRIRAARAVGDGVDLSRLARGITR
ncbi:MAG: replication initiation protein RepC [bacterium]|nr:replication initiation protein RepC [bacterium]